MSVKYNFLVSALLIFAPDIDLNYVKMLRKILKKRAMYLLIAIAAYLVIGYLFHLVIFPENKPPVTTYFKQGQELYSKTEGFRQTVLKQENGHVFCSLIIEPFADGPLKHIHTGFDEYFQISNGELTVWVDGKIKKLYPGETLHVPKGTPHKPYNETADTIHMKSSIAFPEKFAFYLSQVYGIMDNTPAFGKSPKTALQMAMISTAGFDSYVAEGPPVVVQKLMAFLITPLARLLGYKSYYKEYDTHINEKQ
jgi:mannose-6-phosphate isomerase-like protein (cupin superfamily)